MNTELKTEELTREKLMRICEESVVPCTDWDDRDSACAQDNVEEIYTRLHAGIEYTYTVEDDTIWIYFERPNQEQIDRMNTGLDIHTVDDYMELGLDGEMFTPVFSESDKEYHGYLPTEKRLKEVDGQDWY